MQEDVVKSYRYDLQCAFDIHDHEHPEEDIVESKSPIKDKNWDKSQVDPSEFSLHRIVQKTDREYILNLNSQYSIEPEGFKGLKNKKSPKKRGNSRNNKIEISTKDGMRSSKKSFEMSQMKNQKRPQIGSVAPMGEDSQEE